MKEFHYKKYVAKIFPLPQNFLIEFRLNTKLMLPRTGGTCPPGPLRGSAAEDNSILIFIDVMVGVYREHIQNDTVC